MTHDCVCGCVCRAAGYTGKPRVMCGGSLPRQGPGGVWTDTVFGGCVADRSSPKVCPAPPADGPTNGKWPASCTYASAGSNCTAKCNTGYTSTPAPVMTCQADGTWSGVLSGTCEQGMPAGELHNVGGLLCNKKSPSGCFSKLIYPVWRPQRPFVGTIVLARPPG